MIHKLIKAMLLVVAGLSVLVGSAGAFSQQPPGYRDQVAVLMYHHVHPTDRSSSTVSAALFRDQLVFLQQKGFHFLTLAGLRAYLAGGPVPDNAALVTFDDGYESFYTYAYPILQELHVPAVNFIITKDLADPKGSYIPSMSREQIRTMTDASDFIDIGCHTDNLHGKTDGSSKGLLIARLPKPDGGKESEAEYERRVTDDTKACLANIAGVYPRPADSMAYPFGIYDAEAIRLVHDAGVRYGFTIEQRITTQDTDPMRIPRINAGGPAIGPELLYRSIMRRVQANW